jgi:hypothetical protein
LRCQTCCEAGTESHGSLRGASYRPQIESRVAMVYGSPAFLFVLIRGEYIYYTQQSSNKILGEGQNLASVALSIHAIVLFDFILQRGDQLLVVN